jgi:hypothetical protein
MINDTSPGIPTYGQAKKGQMQNEFIGLPRKG